MVVPGYRRVFLRNPLLELQKLDSSIHFIVHAITVKYDGFSRTPEPPEFRRSEHPRRSNEKVLLVGGALTSDWKRSLGQGNVFYTCVSFCSREGEVSASRRSASGQSASGGVCIGGGSVSRRLVKTPHWILWDIVSKQEVYILLECILVIKYFYNVYL